MEQPTARRTPKRKKIIRAVLIFNCSEIVDRIERMLKRVSYGDIIITLELEKPILDGPFAGRNRTSKINVRLGEGWMGKGAEIGSLIYNANGKPYGIIVIFNISDLTPEIRRCSIKNLKNTEDTIHLGESEVIIRNDENFERLIKRSRY
jgi:hypothetical protein